MAEWQTIPLGAKSYQPRAGTVSVERLLNLYAEPNEEGARYPFTLYGRPGLKQWATVGDGPIRGIHAFGSDLYVVSGPTLYHVNGSTKGVTEIGTVGGTGRVQMIDNGVHVAVVTSINTYAANRDELLALPQQYLSSAAYQDGYVIFTQRGTETFWLSGLDDLTTIAALDFSTADTFADNLVGCVSDHRELWLFGERTVEVWYNSGDASFPFSRASSGFIEHGCMSVGSIAKTQNQVFWLGDDKRVYVAQGYTPQPISTPAIDRLIAAASSPTSAEAFTFIIAGHAFYALTFGDLTLVYDITFQRWSEWNSQGIDRWRASGCTLLGSTYVVGDYESGQLYELDLDTYDDAGSEIRREVVQPPTDTGARPAFIAEIFLAVQSGVGLSSGQGSSPAVMLDWSDDDGRTWSTRVESSIGAQGEYRNRATWARLGRSTNRTLRFAITDPVQVAILGAEVRMEAGL